ncbi:PTS transporter subunit EIIC [Mycoplasma mycoides]|uniref:PTS transporter subunit EIIC n=1 Tax=Mycoplasma mycoides TaxID=2102 RepID=UPI0027345D9D|nr:PTS transporter subunit EIIC [Mycoplasma mycoides]MDP4040527.1 PTS transporter subunit EIIC [Mycoplasma mycoides]MDP4042338.1 PTS transporter subunit EIIC [Mycoplasma mycoides]MDP4043740.1 PTS transporter subunit EIIC [Mycoplasma mycoides]MDP4044607.1 PTS transporter subunit EIIC [Mycoplasma mycoides]MDP4045475.1 PTS transporter subunit EIIC [Mycoplasma mycoides]
MLTQTNKSSFKDKLKAFGANIMPTLSKLSKAFLLPIALLPIAGVFLGVGAAIAANTPEQSALWFIGKVMGNMGDVCFGNLPVLFCISVALAYTKDSGVAAITAVVGFLVFNGVQAPLFIAPAARTNDKVFEYSLLWYKHVSNSLTGSNMGILSLNTGVLGGIFVGAIAAKCYNKFHQTQLPTAISFFSGTKLVPIITFVAVIPLSFIFMMAWPVIGLGLNKFGQVSGTLPYGTDSLIFEIVERSLVPFGLHHVFYAPLWWTSAGGSIAEGFNNLKSQSQEVQNAFVQSYNSLHGGTHKTLDEIIKLVQAKEELWGAVGDQIISQRVIGHLNILNFTDVEKLGINLGRFQSGKFGFMLLGLPSAALAMWLAAPKENRQQVFGIYFSAAFTCFLTGITEPIEYTFLFVAPWLFYGVHMPLASIAFWATGALQTHITQTVSGGIIDYIVFGIIPFISGAMKPISAFGVLGVAVVLAPIYFCAFYFLIKLFNVKTPGRDGNAEAKLYTKADFKASKGLNVDGSKMSSSTDDKEQARLAKAAAIIEYLGGEENIVDVDSCASRLRLTVVDAKKADIDGIKSLGGTTGALVKGNNIQIVYGGEQEAIKPRMQKLLEQQRQEKMMGHSEMKSEEMKSENMSMTCESDQACDKKDEACDCEKDCMCEEPNKVEEQPVSEMKVEEKVVDEMKVEKPKATRTKSTKAKSSASKSTKSTSKTSSKSTKSTSSKTKSSSSKPKTTKAKSTSSKTKTTK